MNVVCTYHWRNLLECIITKHNKNGSVTKGTGPPGADGWAHQPSRQPPHVNNNALSPCVCLGPTQCRQIDRALLAFRGRPRENHSSSRVASPGNVTIIIWNGKSKPLVLSLPPFYITIIVIYATNGILA